MNAGDAKVRRYEDRVRRAVNTPNASGRFALWQGGMEPNIPVGSAAGVASGMARAVAGAEREQREGASGKWVAHWKMVHIVRPVWERPGKTTSSARVSAAHLHGADADGLFPLEPAPRTVRGARDLISVALQSATRSWRASRPPPQAGRFFGNDDVLYLMEDMATGEIRLSILWEWLHKCATSRRPIDRSASGGTAHARAVPASPREEYEKLAGRQSRRPRAVEDDDAADRPRDRRDYVTARPSCRGTSIC